MRNGSCVVLVVNYRRGRLFLLFFVLIMALSENLFSTVNRTFRKHRRKMDDIPVWESILISIKKGENGVDSPQEEIHLDVMKRSRLIRIEFVHVEGTINKQHCIEFRDIEDITYPTVSSITLELQDDEYVTFVFPTPVAKEDFKEAITIDSSDSGNSE